MIKEYIIISYLNKDDGDIPDVDYADKEEILALLQEIKDDVEYGEEETEFAKPNENVNGKEFDGIVVIKGEIIDPYALKETL